MEDWSLTKLAQRRRDLLGLASLLLILALAAYLRLTNNTDTPGWYTDEGTHLDIAQHLAQGRMQYLAVNQSTFLFAKLPLFELLLAALLNLSEEGIAILRTLTGLLGVITVALLYVIVRRTYRDIYLALTAALLLAIYPQAVLYSRLGFSYNLLAPLALLTYLGLWQYLETISDREQSRAWLTFTVLIVGLGGISDLWMFLLAAPVLAVVLGRRWQDTFWSMSLLFLPFGVYIAFMLLTRPAAFLFDLRFTLSRLSSLSLGEQAIKLATNYTVLMTQDQWLALAVIGLFLLRPRRLQLLAGLLLGTPIVLLGRTEALYHLSFYYLIPLLPLVSLGAAAALRQGVPYAVYHLHQALAGVLKFGLPDQLRLGLATLAVLALAITPFLVTTVNLVRQSQDHFTTAIDPFLIDPRFARYVARFVNAQTGSGDLVIASPGIAWLIQANTADFQMAMAFSGQATPHLPANLPPERFAFNSDYRQARFIIVDNLWHTWAVFNVPGVAEMLETIKSWRISFQSGNITVYCNPSQPDC